MSLSASGFISWVGRQYKKPTAALGDLLDNCNDATMSATKLSSRWIATKDRIRGTGPDAVVITNGADDVLPLEHCLQFAMSNKKNTDQVGENGVGLKQSILYLSSLGIVISRLKDGSIHVALISKTLNLSSEIEDSKGPVFPRLSFPCESVKPTLEEIRASIKSVDSSLSDWNLARWERYLHGFDLSMCILDALKDAYACVEQRLEDQTSFLDHKDNGNSPLEVFDPDTIYPFFRVILTNSKADDPNDEELNIGDDLVITSSGIAHPAHAVAKHADPSVETWLVKNASQTIGFINLEFPVNFIDTLYYVQLSSSRWEESLEEDEYGVETLEPRLLAEPRVAPLNWHKQFVYFCRKELYIDDDDDYLDAFDIYLGFNPTSVEVKESRLFVYSRGRLIMFEGDFRKLLRLKNYESDYQQGLTVIVNDTNCQLVLDPTKEGIRPCPALWEAVGEVVYAYEKLAIRNVMGSSRSRFNLKLQAAILGKKDAVLEETEDIFLPLKRLDLNILPEMDYNGKSGSRKACFRSNLVTHGEHSINFPPLKEKVKQTTNVDVLFDSLSPKEDMSISRSRKKGSNFHYTPEPINSPSGGGGGASKPPKSKKLTPEQRRVAAIYGNINKELKELLVQYDGKIEIGFTKLFREKYEHKFLPLLSTAKTGKDYYEILMMFEDGIDDAFKCRRWVEDTENAYVCSCHRCTVTKKQWQNDLKRNKSIHSSDEKYAKHLLEKLAELDHYGTDGTRTIDIVSHSSTRGFAPDIPQNNASLYSGNTGNNSDHSKELEKQRKELEKVKTARDEFIADKQKLVEENGRMAQQQKEMSTELEKTKADFQELQASISILFQKSSKTTPSKRDHNDDSDNEDDSQHKKKRSKNSSQESR